MQPSTLAAGDDYVRKPDALEPRGLTLVEETSRTTWPFSDELREQVAKLSEDELLKCENTLRLHLDMKLLKAVRNHDQPAIGP